MKSQRCEMESQRCEMKSHRCSSHKWEMKSYRCEMKSQESLILFWETYYKFSFNVSRKKTFNQYWSKILRTTVDNLRGLIFCWDIYFSNLLRRTTSEPYCPTVPLSTNRKCVWWLLSLKPLEMGQVTEWYGLVVWKFNIIVKLITLTTGSTSNQKLFTAYFPMQVS